MDFIKAIEAERARIQERITTIHGEREKLDEELIKLEAELRAMLSIIEKKFPKGYARIGVHVLTDFGTDFTILSLWISGHGIEYITVYN